jgi:hypothetical protein
MDKGEKDKVFDFSDSPMQNNRRKHQQDKERRH